MSPEEFRESLSRKGVSVVCPVCGAEDWRGLDDIVDLPVRVAGATEHETQVRIPGFEALAPSCGRCGHIRLIDMRWLEAPAPEGPEADLGRQSTANLKLTETNQGEPTRPARERLTNIWGQPIARDKKR